MTSHTIHHSDPLRSALGTHYEVQIKVLKAALHMYETMKFSGWAKKFPRGGKISINGTISLHQYLKNVLNIPYLRVAILNQCWVERFFGQIRDMGGSNRHPSALHFLFKMQRKVTSCILDDPTFDLSASIEMFEKAAKDNLPSESKEIGNVDATTTTPVHEAIEKCENETDGLTMIAGIVAQKTSYLGLNLGSKTPEIEQKPNSQFQQFVDSGQSIIL